MINKKKTRNYGLDLFRLMCMYMVVLLHYLGHGGLIPGTLNISHANWLPVQILDSCSYVAVNGFVLISSYFLCTSTIKPTRFLQVYTQTSFYSITLYLGLAIVGAVNFTVSSTIDSLLILSRDRYWFVSTYLSLLLFAPILNASIDNIGQRAHLLCCGLLVVMFSVIPSLIPNSVRLIGDKSLSWFCTLYLIAAYIRKYVPRRALSPLILLTTFLVCVALLVVQSWYSATIPDPLFSIKCHSSIVILTATSACFLFFRDLDIKSRFLANVIASVAPLSFAVYLIHDHPNIRHALWYVLTPYKYAASVWLIPHLLVCVTGIFLVCCLIEALRRFAFRMLHIDDGITYIGKKLTQAGSSLLTALLCSASNKDKRSTK